MSHHGSRGAFRDGGHPHLRGHPRPTGPGPGRVKRWKTKRERDTAKFGGKIPGGGRRGAGPPPCRRPLLLPWGGHPAASPLLAPRAVVITQNRLCQHRGMFNREVKSVDVERLLSPRPARDTAPHGETPLPGDPEGDPHPAEPPPVLPSHPEAPQSEGEQWVPTEPPPLQELAGRLGALLGGTPAFPGRDLVGERRRALLDAFLRRHRALPDLSFLLAHRNRGVGTAPPGRWSPQSPERELSGGGSSFGEREQRRDLTPPYSSAPAPLQAVVNKTPPYPARPGTPSPIFGGGKKKREPPFSWTSGEEEQEEEEDPRPDSPAPLFQPGGAGTPPWGDPRRRGGDALAHGWPRPPPGSPRGCAKEGSPWPHAIPAPFGGDAGEGCSWSQRLPIAPPAFSPAAPRHRRPPRRAVAVPFAARCRRASPDPRNPDAWSPEASLRPGFAPGWPCAERRAPCCRRLHLPRHNDPPRHSSHCPGQPAAPPSPGPCCCSPLGHRAPPESRQWWDWWDVPEEPGCQRSREKPGWLRALRRLPLSWFCPPAALEQDGSPPSSPEAWGCPCAGLY